jgi:2'-5' RNA ligase
LVIAVPEAEPHVAALRLVHDSSAALGVPAHVTILFPFAPPESVDEEALAGLVASHSAFAFELASVEHFGEDVTYLAPVPADPFSVLTRAVAARWPDYPPYEGVHDEVVPHLTVGEARLELAPPLPISCEAREVLLLEEEPGGHWRLRRRFPLGEMR